jgi:hypothetical protein
VWRIGIQDHIRLFLFHPRRNASSGTSAWPVSSKLL